MKKIFISHSSLDKELVDVFIDKILILGLNLEVKDIACTSREDTGVMTGSDIRDFIKENISSSDFVLFMISENYKKSAICLNEMGAAWATDREVKPIVFPNVDFDSIGWLYNVRRGMKLNDGYALDSLYEEISEKCKCTSRISTWNKSKHEFLDFLANNFNQNIKSDITLIAKKTNEDELDEDDLLDCREKFDKNIHIHQESLARITKAVEKNTEATNKGTKILQRINESSQPNPTQVRNLMLKIAYESNSLADVFDEESPVLKNAFNEAMNVAIKIRELAGLDEDDIEKEYQSIKDLIDSMNDSLESTISYRQSLEEGKTRLEKTYEKAKKRLIDCLSNFIDITEECINKANELLFYT